MSLEVRCVWDVRSLLGEGPVWDVARQMLWFVDIKRGYLHGYAPERDRLTIALGGNPSFVLPSQLGGLVIGNRRSIHHLVGEQLVELAQLHIPARCRFNDATVDPKGRIWFGSMDDAGEQRLGQVHLYDRGTITDVGASAAITNGPAVSADGQWLYHVDTLNGQIWRFDIGHEARLDNGQLFATIAPEDGTPDGVTIDAEDHVWVCLWGGWAARRYAPSGDLTNEVRFPCANITKIAFGGPDLRTAYATTASVDLSAHALEQQPLAGGLFAFEVQVPGRPLPTVHIGGGEIR